MKVRNRIYILGIIILIVICIFAVYSVVNKVEKQEVNADSEGNLIVHFIDVSQGDAAFVLLPNGETMLIDAGEKSKGESVINYINNLGYDKLDYVVGTHPHSDHIGGLESVVNNFSVGDIYMPKVVANSNIYKNLLNTIKSKNKTIKKAFKGVNIIEEDGLDISFLSPNKEEYSNLNNYSAVIKIDYQDTCFLFMGDAETEVERELNIKDCDVIKVGHHGSSTSSSIDFVEKINPKYAIISVGENNKYGLPSKKVLNRYEDINTEIYRTDLNGTIKVVSDGKNINIYKERG